MPHKHKARQTIEEGQQKKSSYPVWVYGKHRGFFGQSGKSTVRNFFNIKVTYESFILYILKKNQPICVIFCYKDCFTSLNLEISSL